MPSWSLTYLSKCLPKRSNQKCKMLIFALAGSRTLKIWSRIMGYFRQSCVRHAPMIFRQVKSQTRRHLRPGDMTTTVLIVLISLISPIYTFTRGGGSEDAVCSALAIAAHPILQVSFVGWAGNPFGVGLNEIGSEESRRSCRQEICGQHVRTHAR